MNGIELIAEERKRQIEEEGFTAEHDVGYCSGALAYAAVCYALPRKEGSLLKNAIKINFTELFWPWTSDWWKPTPKNASEN